jgi:hypothetical protein
MSLPLIAMNETSSPKEPEVSLPSEPPPVEDGPPMADEGYVVNLLQRANEKTIKKSKTTTDWYDLILEYGRLQACVELGMITDPESLENITKGIQHNKIVFLTKVKIKKPLKDLIDEYLVFIKEKKGTGTIEDETSK